MKTVDENEGKAAVIWILGEYGDTIQEAPYILETFIDNYDMNEDSVRLELLTASMKLLFKRPPEMQKMLGRLLEQATNDSRVDIRDRSLMYYRLLQTSIAEAKRVVSCPRVAAEDVLEE